MADTKTPKGRPTLPRKRGRGARVGTVVLTRDRRYQPMVRLADGSKMRLDPLPLGTTLDSAREIAREAQEKTDRLGIARPDVKQATEGAANCEAWVTTWNASRARLSSARVSLGHWKVHLRPLLGSKHPKDWTRDDYRRVSKALDDYVAAGKVSWKTAQNIWCTATKMAADAVGSKDDAIRCRDDNPANGVRGPDSGDKVDLQYLFPSEFKQLMAASPEAVSVEWRRVIAVATYLYARVGELRALTWSDVYLDKGYVSITKAIDATTGKLKTTKTKCPRKVPIEPALLPLLRVMRAEANGVGPVVTFPNVLHQADALRGLLKAAEVERPKLYDKGPSVRPIRFHDLRATGITWRAVRGDSPLEIKRHAGHRIFATTERYIREAEDVRGSFGTPFPPLPPALLRKIGTRNGTRRQKSSKSSGKGVGAAGFEPATSSV